MFGLTHSAVSHCVRKTASKPEQDVTLAGILVSARGARLLPVGELGFDVQVITLYLEEGIFSVYEVLGPEGVSP